MRSWWLPALVSSGLAVLSGCGGAFDPTYNLTCPGPLAAKASGAANLVYTSADPISVDWRVTPSTTGTFVQPTTVGPATNEDEPVTVGSQFNAAAEGTATISAVVDGDTVASCTVQVLPEGVEPVTLTLVVVGMGSVSGSAGNLACPGTCSASLVPETAVTLTPTPATNWDLTSVTGGCTDAGNGTYTVAPAVDTTCVFTFEDASAPSFVTIPAGPFSRGCDGANCSGDAPLTTVTFSQAYDIDLNEVTVSQYKACVDGGPCTEPLPRSAGTPCNWGEAGKDNFPVNCVTWAQADAYCSWRGGALPTEAQWERAARGDVDTRNFPWGNDNPTCDMAAVILVPFMRCAAESTAVGQHPTGVSPDGLHDMVGNVSEWVADWYDGAYYMEATSLVDPTGPATSPIGARGVRGGNYNLIQDLTTVHERSGHLDPNAQDPTVGFRCVKN